MYNLNSTIKKKNAYYSQFPRDGKCQFCNLPEDQRLDETHNFIILRNKFSYDIFDLCEVTDHLMVIPKNHIDRLESLSESEKIELMDILIGYESKGYNVYFREPKSSVKTVDHHHTHLFKLGKRLRSIEYTKDPYSMQYKI